MIFTHAPAHAPTRRAQRTLATLVLSLAVMACNGDDGDARAETAPDSNGGGAETQAMETAAAAAMMNAAAANAQAGDQDCRAKLDRLDAHIADGLDMTDAEAAVFADMRDSAAQMCARGQGAMAGPLLDGLLERAGAEAPEPEMEATDVAGAESSQDEAAVEEAPPEDYALGAPREDLDRFYGLYQLPDSENRRLFVAPADNGNPDRPIPDGYLMVGAMWGDAANWFMKSLSDTEFEQQFTSYEPVRVNFITDADGDAEAMSISSRYMNYDRMERVDDLPEGWR